MTWRQEKAEKLVSGGLLFRYRRLGEIDGQLVAVLVFSIEFV
jgi:hypothetical protein